MATLDPLGDVTIDFIGGGRLDGVFTFQADANSAPVAENVRLAWGFYDLTGGEDSPAVLHVRVKTFDEPKPQSP
jgi:hypothetical protein